MIKNIHKSLVIILFLLLSPLSVVAQEDVVPDKEEVEKNQKEDQTTLQKILNKLDIPQKHKRLVRALFKIFTEEDKITAHATLEHWETTDPLDLIKERAKDVK